MHVSPSQIERLRRCPRKIGFEYVENIKDGTAREVEETKRGSGRKIRVEPEAPAEIQATNEDERR